MLRLVLSPRWVMWHVLTIGAMVTCGFLAAWQWHRAGSAMGSALNIGYGLQWPLFAIFFGAMWYRFLRLEVRQLRADGPGTGTLAPATGEVPVPRHELVAVEPEPAGPSPFGPRPAAARPVTDDEDPELAAYNRMLAALAAHDRENP